jgi:hypothetical protein
MNFAEMVWERLTGELPDDVCVNVLRCADGLAVTAYRGEWRRHRLITVDWELAGQTVEQLVEGVRKGVDAFGEDLKRELGLVPRAPHRSGTLRLRSVGAPRKRARMRARAEYLRDTVPPIFGWMHTGDYDELRRTL